MKRENSTAEQGTGKPKKSIFKKWWFWLIILLVLAGAAAPKNSDDPGTSTPPPASSAPSDASKPDEPEPEAEPVVSAEEAKEAAKSVDAEITAICTAAESDYQQFMDIVNSGKASDLDIYNNAKTLKKNLQYYNYTQLSAVKGEGIDDYKESASLYCFLMTEVAEKAMDYLDDPITSKLSKYQEAIEDANEFVYNVVAARFTFLSEAGFTSEEIGELTSAGAEE